MRHAVALVIALALGVASRTALAGYAFEGQGITNVITGSVANGNLVCATVPTWINAYPISLPCTNNVTFTLPACDRAVASRLVMTVWGGTADYTCQMSVTVNGTNLPAANPFVFGTTADTNAVFNANAPCAYGSGYGVWLVALPVPPEMLYTNGSANTVSVVETTPDFFDGRIQHVTLMAVYQSASLANTFDYAIAEGSGDIRGTPSAPQVDHRVAVLGAVNSTNAAAATLTALYTYAHTGQNDELFFNGSQLGGEDVAQWDTSLANYGPSVVSFDVLANLKATNTITFDVSAADVPSPRESALRPQLAVLAVTRVALSAGRLALTGVDGTGSHITWSGPASGNFAVEACTNLVAGKWDVLTNFTSNGGTLSFTDGGATNFVRRYYRAKTQ